MNARPPARDHLAPAPLVAAADWAQDGPQDGRTDGRTKDQVYLGWSLAAQVVFLRQIAALETSAERPLSRRELGAAAKPFGLAAGHLVRAGIVAPVRRGHRQCWADNASAAAGRWVALMTGAKL